MAIEITEFANVTISVSPTGVAGGNFGILGFLTTDDDLAVTGKGILPAERFRSYTSLASVAGDWQATSEVYKAATAFYGQTPTPTDFVVQMNYQSSQVATLVGGGSGTPEAIIAGITGTGVLSMTIDGTPTAITDLDLSTASSATHDAIAEVLEDEIQAVVGLSGVTAVHNGYQYVISGATAGTGTITFAADSDAANLLGLQQNQGKLSQGFTAETATEALAAADTLGIEAVGLVTHKKFRDDGEGALASGNSIEDIAIYAEAAERIFCNTTNDLTTLVANGTSHVAYKLKNRTLRFSLTTFSKDNAAYPSASVFGRAASVNFSAVGSTITLNLKQMPGIAAEDLTPAEFAALRSYNASAVVQIGKTVNAYTDSRMASGSWLDTTHGLLWLENRAEVDMFNLLYVNNTKIPFTQQGINTAEATLQRSLRAAVRNGLCAPGYLPDGTYLPEGFVTTAVPLADVPAGDKGNRIYSGLSFKMVGAGALHEVIVSGEFSE